MKVEIKTGKQIFDELENISHNEFSTREDFKENQKWQDLEIAIQEFRWVSLNEILGELWDIMTYVESTDPIYQRLRELYKNLKSQ